MVLRQIRLHSNPFTLDFDNQYQHSSSVLFGSTEVIPQITEDITNYTMAPEDSVWTLAIKGKPGSGKSLFARCLLIDVIKNHQRILSPRYNSILVKNKYFAKSLQFEYIVSSCNPEVAKRFVGIWLPVLRRMLEVLSNTTKTRPNGILNKMLEYSSAADSK